jgi:hypothetical protein
MKFDFWIELPKYLTELRKEDTTEEESQFLNDLENSYNVRK